MGAFYLLTYISPILGETVVSPVVVVVYHVTIVAIGHGLLEKFWPLVLGCVLRTAGSSTPRVKFRQT